MEQIDLLYEYVVRCDEILTELIALLSDDKLLAATSEHSRALLSHLAQLREARKLGGL